MERVLALGQDMALLWTRYAPLYLSGVVNTLLLAVAATVLGCLIGLACGLLNTIPIHPQDRLPRRVLLRTGRRRSGRARRRRSTAARDMIHMTMVAREAMLMKGRKKSLPVKGVSTTKAAVNQMQRAGVPYFGWRAENALDTSAKRDRP